MTHSEKGSAIDCYSAGTTNGRRVVIMLEETGLPYFPIWLDLTCGEHRAPAFLAINPEGAVPAIVDHGSGAPQPVTLSQSAAILIYLAEKSGLFLPQGAEKYHVLRWLMFGISDVACATASALQLSFIKEDTRSADAHFSKRIARYLMIAEQQLDGRDFLAGVYSIADMCLYPNTLIPPTAEMIGQGDRYPKLRRWQERMAERPAVARAVDLCPPPGSMPSRAPSPI
jgi:GSH-dependent disulfide-bond oxidoreductase